jgi:hypothetical protein
MEVEVPDLIYAKSIDTVCVCKCRRSCNGNDVTSSFIGQDVFIVRHKTTILAVDVFMLLGLRASILEQGA